MTRRVVASAADRLSVVILAHKDFKVYGDESSDEKSERVFLVCSVVGLEQSWIGLEAEWKTILGDRQFHSKEWDDPDAFDALVASVAKARGIWALVSWLDLSKPETSRGKAKNAYYVCFQANIYELANAMNALSETLDSVLPVEVTFDHREPSEATAGAMYSDMAAHNELNRAVFNSKVTFDFSRNNARLQVADLIACVVRRDLDREIEKRAKPTRHRKMLRAVIVDDVYGRLIATMTPDEKNADKSDYIAWLFSTGRFQETKKGKVSFHDTVLNRVLFRESRRTGLIPELRGKRRQQVIRLLNAGFRPK